MKVRLAAEARRDRDQYLLHVWADDPAAATREAQRLRAALGVDGPEVRIAGWPRVVREQFVHPFRMYYERQDEVLYVVRLYHYARRPITR